MGDRGNIYLKQNGGTDPGIYLYSHWGGTELPEILQEALKRGRDRWSDEQYLGRIVFNQMTKGLEMELTGCGITTYPCDNEHLLLVVDSANRRISVQSFPFDAKEEPAVSFSFEEYIGLDKKQLRSFFRTDD